jgi:2-iminoacetate synthase
MEGGIDDVGLGVLFGLADYRFEVLALMEHAAHLEKVFGCGPHTISFPRIEPAENAPLPDHIPFPVSDDDFKKIVAIIRIALPYTGIILSTRESEEMRTELFEHGVSQLSAGSRTNPGAYSEKADTGSQFSLGDHRTLDEVISTIIDRDYIPSFCTGCYRKGRVGSDFMDLAKPGLIKEFCMPNAVFTFNEYLQDFASPPTKEKGLRLIAKLMSEVENEPLRRRMSKALAEINGGARDVYF